MLRKVDNMKVELVRELSANLDKGALPEVEEVLLLDALLKDPAIANPVVHNMNMLLVGAQNRQNLVDLYS